MKKDRISNTAISNGSTAAVKTVSENGVIIDLQQYMDGVMFIANVGSAGDSFTATAMYEIEVEESTDGVTFTDVADSDLINSVTGTNTGTFLVINADGEAPAVAEAQYVGIKRYARPVVNVTNTGAGDSFATGTPISISAVALGYKYPPVS